MALIEYTPQRILTTENMSTKSVVTSEHWNEVINLLTSQGNNSALAMYNLINAIAATTAAAQVGATTITGVTGTTVQTIMAGLKGLIDACYTSAATDSLLSQKETIANANQLVKTISFNSANGTFTITTQGGTVSTIDTALEKVAINFAYDQATQSLILTLVDGSTTTIPLSAFIQENDFLDSDTVDFSVTDHTVTANIKNGSITEAMLSSVTLATLIGYKNNAETAATNAAASEANALTYKNNANTSAGEALASKNAAKISETNAKTSETNAKTSETNSGTYASNAATSAGQALQYRNEAAAIVGDKVISFNGRKDTVMPATGDYTADMVGAIPDSQKGAADGVASLGADSKVLPEQLPAFADTSVTLSDPVKTALALTGTKYVSDALTKLSGAALRKTVATNLSTLADGAEFTLNETISGTTTAVKFIKLKNNYEGSGRVLVLRKSAIINSQWNTATLNTYAGSILDNYLNTTYIAYLDSVVQAQLSNVTIPYTGGAGDKVVSSIARKCFALSATELGLSQTYANIEGTTVPYFSSDAKRNISVMYWTRSPYIYANTNGVVVTSAGGMGSEAVNMSYPQVRPTFTLPADFSINPVNNIVDMAGNEFVLPYAKIATGSYTGTGTFGSGDPNSLTFSFTPKVVIVASRLMQMVVFINPNTQNGVIAIAGNYACATTWNSNSISWYSDSASNQQNGSSTTFYYVALG